MLKNSRNQESYIEKVNKVIEKVKKQGYTDIMADIENYDKPPRLIGKSKEVNFVPDVVARKNGSKGYFEISKKEKKTNDLVNKWTALSLLVDMKHGVFRIYVPHGHMKFTRQLLTTYEIKAEVSKL